MFGLGDFLQPGAGGGTDSEFIRVQDWSEEERLAGEKETLGFYLKGHPITRYEDELKKLITTPLKDISMGSVIVAGYIHRIRARSGIRGRMAEILLDDRTARANLTVYSDKFNEYRSLLTKDQLIIVRGEVVPDDFIESGYSIIAREIYNMDQARSRFAALKLRITEERSNRETIEKLRRTLVPYCSGTCRVGIEYRNGKARCRLDLGDHWKVRLNDSLLDLLRNSFGRDNVMVEYTVQ